MTWRNLDAGSIPLAWLRALARRLRRTGRPVRDPRTFNMVLQDYFFEPKEGGLLGHIGAWEPPQKFGWLTRAYPEAGDYLLLRNGNGITRYRVVNVTVPVSQPDPPGQWFADLVFAPRGGGTP